jgi:hypothetical protein
MSKNINSGLKIEPKLNFLCFIIVAKERIETYLYLFIIDHIIIIIDISNIIDN